MLVYVRMLGVCVCTHKMNGECICMKSKDPLHGCVCVFMYVFVHARARAHIVCVCVCVCIFTCIMAKRVHLLLCTSSALQYASKCVMCIHMHV
jgi:hypothetical protein